MADYKVMLTGSCRLKSPAQYDNARNIAETTHVRFGFGFYTPGPTGQLHVRRGKSYVLTIEQLYALVAGVEGALVDVREYPVSE